MTLYKFISTITFLYLTVFSFGQSENITCTIKSDKATYKTGDTPKIIIEIKNNTDSSFYLVKVLDASYRQSRYPYSYFTIEKVNDTTYKTRQVIGCGNEDGIDTADFVMVKPSETFDPYKNQTIVYWDPVIWDPRNFEEKGKYKITYYYSTNEMDFKKWMGWDMNSSWFDWQTKEIKPKLKDTYERLINYFEKLPKVDLVSNEIVIKIK